MTDPAPLTGYAHPGYAASLAEFGTPRALPRCGGWLLQRPVPGAAACDAMSCYPRFVCRDWSCLPADLSGLSGLVSLTLVTDPFADLSPARLRPTFDLVRPFKHHFVTELDRPAEQIVSRSHRATVRRALRRVEVELCPDPARHLDDWGRAFDCLKARHGITGLRAFSRAAFARQLAVPGLVMFRALAAGQPVGFDLWYVHGPIAYGHLAAYTPEGYRRRASYATKWHVLRHFAGKVRWLDLGAGAGLAGDAADGLSAFKRGWASATRPAYLCGRILDPVRYAALAQAAGAGATTYFPAYRHGEFA